MTCDHHAVLDLLGRERATAILRTPHADAVLPALEAAAEGGFRILECTLTTPGALDAIEKLARRPDLCVGAGTVLSLDDAERSVAAGASFLVSPVCDLELIRWCSWRRVVVIPGTFTPTEMLTAHRSGAAVVKLFPAPADGPAFLRAVLAPMPFLKILPTNGVTEQNAASLLEAGAFAVGFVASLFAQEDLAGGRFDRVRERATRCLAAVKGVSAPRAR